MLQVILLSTCASAWFFWQPPLCAPNSAGGRYVEARTASVFAGACHFGAEATTQGREALIAWHFERGEHAGVALAGVDLAAAIAGDENLADGSVTRHSLLYVSRATDAHARAAAVDLIRASYPELLGRVDAVEPVDLHFAFDADAYALRANDRFEVIGCLLPDRACCRMPHSVWYAPLCSIDAPVVGFNSSFSFRDEELGRLWSRADENTTISGSFTISLRKE